MTHAVMKMTDAADEVRRVWREMAGSARATELARVQGEIHLDGLMALDIPVVVDRDGRAVLSVKMRDDYKVVLYGRGYQKVIWGHEGACQGVRAFVEARGSLDGLRVSGDSRVGAGLSQVTGVFLERGKG